VSNQSISVQTFAYMALHFENVVNEKPAHETSVCKHEGGAGIGVAGGLLQKLILRPSNNHFAVDLLSLSAPRCMEAAVGRKLQQLSKRSGAKHQKNLPLNSARR